MPYNQRFMTGKEISKIFFNYKNPSTFYRKVKILIANGFPEPDKRVPGKRYNVAKVIEFCNNTDTGDNVKSTTSKTGKSEVANELFEKFSTGN